MYYYNAQQDSDGLWLVENHYDQRYCKKSESVFTIANGTVGIRGSQDLKGLVESRGMFVRGFYHKAEGEQVSELVNCPDIMMNEIVLNGSLLSLDSSVMESYDRRFNTETGELRFKAVFRTGDGCRMELRSRRFASLAQTSIVCQDLQIKLLEGRESELTVKLGVNGQISNSGAAHLTKTECRVLDGEYLHFAGTAGTSEINILEQARILFDGKACESCGLERRSIYKTASGILNPGETLTIEKTAAICLHDDKEGYETDPIAEELVKSGTYEGLFLEHLEKCSAFWKVADVRIDGASPEDMAALKYSQFQLYGMTPQDGGASSIAAKGLTGEGYKGHVFWDTEMFMLPFYIHTFPEIAKDLLMYRYRRLEGAREKAQAYGYQGAMYPWESAGDGREETPLFAALNIYTGKATPILSGCKEHHVAADIGYAILNYYQTTGDWEFILTCGLEMLVGISTFWASRAVERNGRLEILDIIGPDEYTESIDNNAFTNYMAKYVAESTLALLSKAHDEAPASVNAYKEVTSVLEDFCKRIYLPVPNEQGIIPQDDTFLSKPELPDIEEFRESPIKQAVLLKHSRQEVIEAQTTKQADVVMLLNLFPNLINKDLLRKNVEYYEARTLHDSSLSYCTHAQACANVGLMEMASHFFRKALESDLSANPTDSLDGLHAASLGGIWNCIIQGFAGLSTESGNLVLNPHLPKEWKSISFRTVYKGRKYQIKATAEEAVITPLEE